MTNARWGEEEMGDDKMGSMDVTVVRALAS